MNVLNKNVEVYYNLHKKCLSVRKRGLVIAHVRSILLKNAEFVVQPAGRKRVLTEKRKNVHAYVRGERVAVASFDGKSERITYNPYKKKNPQILICDEITSALDTETEKKLLDCLNNLAGKITIIFISHSNNVIKNADKVYSLEYDKNMQSVLVEKK